MAKLSSDKKYVTVEKGDTLSKIAKDYKSYSGNATYQQLAAINGIPDPNKIGVGDKIYLKGEYLPGTPRVINSTSKVTIKQFALQSNSDNLLFVTWDWSGKSKELDHYEVEWRYGTGDDVWFVGSDDSTTAKQSTYSIPSNAKSVTVRVKPVSKTYKKNNKDTKYFTGAWCDKKKFYTKNLPPVTPSVPSVEIDKYTLTASISDINASELRAKGVQFQIVKDDTKVFKTGKATINTKTNYVSYSCTVSAGSEYKVRCRTYDGDEYSDWTDYSSPQQSIPSASKGIKTLKAKSATEVLIDWHNVKNATGYIVECTTQKRYFDSGTSEVKTVTVNSPVGHAEVTGLESGEEWFFRVRATNDAGQSEWTEIKSIIIGTPPAAPTTWSSTTTVITGEKLVLYWVHNSKDNSYQSMAEVKLTINGKSTSKMVSVKVDENSPEPTYSYEVDTSEYAAGVRIDWCVRTGGITEEPGAWSISRTVLVYAPPSLELNAVFSSNGRGDTYPIIVSTEVGPITQKPVGYSLTVIANETYETVDNLGNPKIVKVGNAVYNKHFDITTNLSLTLSAGDINLESDIKYTMKCVVSMDSGLTAEDSLEFKMDFGDQEFTPNAEIGIDKETLVAHIHPYCERIVSEYHIVKKDGDDYVVTSDRVLRIYGTEMVDTFTITGEQVFFGTTAEGDVVYYCEVVTSTMVGGATVAVYRREFDGGFTEIASGIKSANNTFVTDPHPALDYARYRVVATSNETGAISFYDVPGEPVGESAAIIQWDEEWSEFDTEENAELEQPAWSGSLLKLLYNIDVSESSKQDVELTEYIGREHPVSYYGTQVGQISTWNVDIKKSDKDTLYALRRLQRWMGDVYVRESSGTGYWANITVSFSQNHRELTIPVSLSITRVEGGM